MSVNIETVLIVLGGFIVTYVTMKVELKKTIKLHRRLLGYPDDRNKLATALIERELERTKRHYTELLSDYQELVAPQGVIMTEAQKSDTIKPKNNHGVKNVKKI